MEFLARIVVPSLRKAVASACSLVLDLVRHGKLRTVSRIRPLPPAMPRRPEAEHVPASLAEESDVLRDLERGLKQDQLQPFFQPQVDLRTGELIGLEALVRWRHPKRGLLFPADFLDCAEAAGLGSRITARMLETSLAALSGWRLRGISVPRVSINFTAQELRDSNLATLLAFELDKAGLDPSDLTIEILESALSREAEDPVPRNIASLALAGYGMDLDDFGRGAAELADLERLAIERVKIDRSLLLSVDKNPRQRATMRSIVDAAHAIGLRTVGEGAETSAHLRLLTQIGCDHVQGFAIARPMPEQDVPGWITDHERRRSLGRAIAAA